MLKDRIFAKKGWVKQRKTWRVFVQNSVILPKKTLNLSQTIEKYKKLTT